MNEVNERYFDGQHGVYGHASYSVECRVQGNVRLDKHNSNIKRTKDTEERKAITGLGSGTSVSRLGSIQRSVKGGLLC